MMSNKKIAVIVPCYNEAQAVYKVVSDFRKILPAADIYVFDNNSTDETAAVANEAGALVRHVGYKGKGNVVRRMFADVDADIYVMVDGDDTYEAAAAPKMIEHLLNDNLDMVVGTRVENGDEKTYRPGHRFGNKMLTGTVSKIFKGSFSDMLSGYRVFSRRYAKSFPSHSHGFEIETELTIHALELRMRIGEVQTAYGERPEGSVSKLSTYRDGIKILRTIIQLYAYERPLFFYTMIALFMATISFILGVPLIDEYLQTGLVPRFPTAIAAASVMVMGMLSLICGVISHLITVSRRETKYLAYLSIPGE
ncbi:TPA: glycosyltransferase [Salmonella enterica subsp. enterica serovar Cotham]|uniref:Glycosyltransferase n=1 Tax=Salmonella enterica subsp. enterica serovar Cotham TaxID=2572724 RepID=A0A5I2YL48_SALET|nr:glycosyl transferase [Salmonella enterica subsp. enterica serovar Cotham]EAB1501272.1 glycosyltransferase [Salmonella enterica]ECT8369197.1 glycosyltransferase [Salmonella enterica subsp. enterica serovar O rough]EHA9195582.1 glycosyltransferase [Salmonella enterica subsp. enterica serovar Volkmarsdorf]EHG3460795.1 glycosyltransferase [Salmonella enterica subsp. enterica serovar Moero]